MGHDPVGRGWNPPSVPTPIEAFQPDAPDEGCLEAIQFRGDNFPEVNLFLRGRGYLLGSGAMLVDADDRTFLLRLNDYVVRWPNGVLTRHRPSTAVSPSQYGI